MADILKKWNDLDADDWAAEMGYAPDERPEPTELDEFDELDIELAAPVPKHAEIAAFAQ